MSICDQRFRKFQYRVIIVDIIDVGVKLSKMSISVKTVIIVGFESKISKMSIFGRNFRQYRFGIKFAWNVDVYLNLS